MINEKVILLTTRFGDTSEHRLSKYVSDYSGLATRLYHYRYKPLQEIFSKVIPYDYTKRMAETGVRGVNEEVIELVRKEHPKYVLWLPAEYEFMESTLDVIRKEGSIVIGWFVDDEYRFDNYSKWWIPHLDYCITFDIEVVPKYKALGARIVHVLFCEGIPVDYDWSNIGEKYDISFIGSMRSKPNREQYINALKNRNIPVHIFGEGAGRYIPFEGMVGIFGDSKINLNFAGVTGSDRLAIKGRLTEISLAGGFVLTEYAPGTEKCFEIDKEIVCFRNTEELLDKVIYYLDHDEERRAIAQAGWKRATNEYTPFHMISRIFGEIEEDIAAKDKKDHPHPQELKMPRLLRNSHSQYYFRWGRAFLETNYKGLWKDALALALWYNPLNIGARYYYVVGFLPPFIRPALFKLYKPCAVAEELYTRLRNQLLRWADSIPYLREMKRSAARRLHYT
ncbi:glycosyltransferase [Chloroflexota bacterium]